MASAKHDPFGPRLPGSLRGEDESGLRLRSADWPGEAGHRLHDEAPTHAEELLSLFDEGFDDDDTVIADGLGPSLELGIYLAEAAGLDVDIEVEEPSLDIEIAVEEPACEERDVDIDVELPPAREYRAFDRGPARHPLEAAVALRSESHLWEGFDGELGVFVATYEELPIGTPVELTLHLLGEPPLTLHATVRFLRDDPTQWRGLGLQLDHPTAYLREAYRRFGRRRRPAFF